ncbi:hypothetical protein MNBD_GAMMA16-2025 [hydrothermal vent metagenome]|uniref:YecA family protein n=1 Tax=hydrothermal vent metagenome TaxID=652676 RepID=A0A3B0Z602_9ZZZZ
MTQALPSFFDVHDELLEYDLAVHPAESHGAMCGAICSQRESNFVDWCHTVLFEMDTGLTTGQPGEATLQRDSGQYTMLALLHRAAVLQLADSDYGFQLFLPDDNADVADRSDALAAWCRGFLFGLTASGINKGTPFSIETNELIHDFSEISQLDFENVDESDEGDAVAFEEVMEYVRVGVLFIWAELMNQRSSITPIPVKH